MSALTDDYFRDLPPGERRYDTPLGDGLVFSVFPNGTKCWVLVYSAGGFARRRTLGLFPEMGMAAARSAVRHAQQILRVEQELAQSGERTAAGPRRGWVAELIYDRPLAAAGLGIGTALLIGLFVVWVAG